MLEKKSTKHKRFELKYVFKWKKAVCLPLESRTPNTKVDQKKCFSGLVYVFLRYTFRAFFYFSDTLDPYDSTFFATHAASRRVPTAWLMPISKQEEGNKKRRVLK